MPDFVDTTARLLSLLLEQNSLSASSVKSKASREVFTTLEQTGVVQKKRKGAGNQYQLLSQSSLVEFINSRYPSGVYRKEAKDTPRRVQGIREKQNSKSLSKLDFSLITLRGSSSIKQDGKVYNLVQLTTKNTFLSLKLTNTLHPENLQKNSTIVTVENQTDFTELESMMQRPWDITIYTGGKMSNILLQQLRYWANDGHKLVHFGDYDYVGLLEFTRIIQICPKAELYSPDKLSTELIQQYGNTLLLEKQVSAHQTFLKNLEALPDSLGKDQLSNAYKLLQENAKGLEQESFY
jgi:hypothetical protein